MSPSVEPRITNTQRSGWCVPLVTLAIIALTVSLATRTLHLSAPHGTAVQSSSASAMRQHMDRDSVRWVDPVPVFAAFEAPTFYPFVAPAGTPLGVLLLDQSLYNRPPPSC